MAVKITSRTTALTVWHLDTANTRTETWEDPHALRCDTQPTLSRLPWMESHALSRPKSNFRVGTSLDFPPLQQRTQTHSKSSNSLPQPISMQQILRRNKKSMILVMGQPKRNHVGNHLQPTEREEPFHPTPRRMMCLPLNFTAAQSSSPIYITDFRA
jgi:hypothetical protein